MSGIDPDLIPEAWDFAIIAGHSTPGLCTISQGGRTLKWEKKAAFGKAGATTKLTGIEPGEFQLTIRFYDEPGVTAIESRAFYEQVTLPALQEAESGKKALDFYHPAVSEPPCNIVAIVPQKLGIYEQDSDGTWSVTHSLLQYGKPKAAVGAPSGSGKKKPQKETALDENEKKIAALTKELKGLAAE